VAYADLGGLGSKQGTAVTYDWKAPNVVPALLPWLAILALLALKRNRCAAAWWVGVPLLCVGGLLLVPQSLLEFLPSGQLEMFLEMIGALGFGAAAVWLLAGYLEWKHPLLAFLGILVVQEAFSILTFMLGHGLEADSLQMLVPLSFAGFALPAALSLAGLLCGKRKGWWRLSLWLIPTLMVTWIAVLGAFFFYERMRRGANIPWYAFLVVAWVAFLISLGVLLPFLVLTFANGFYRERMKGVFHLGAPAPPPIAAPPMPAVAEVPRS
jgi:hypothetical protein